MPLFRTDLAMEAFDGRGGKSLDGVRVNRWETNGVTLTEVLIDDHDAARMLGKPEGAYLTMECPSLRRRDPDGRKALTGVLGEELSRMMPEASNECVLVVGLGNRGITPDALGPAVVERTLVTRHLAGPGQALHGLRPVCAVAPGVLGVTGIETVDVVESLVTLVRPCAVVCIDSLAARDSARIGSTIQLSNAGIQPGAGVGNHRSPLTRDTLGVPVVAVGMPTVIYAATLARDAFEWLDRENNAGERAEEREAALADMERALLRADVGEMIVTPREIDAMIEDAASVIASGINRALQPSLSDAELSEMSK